MTFTRKFEAIGRAEDLAEGTRAVFPRRIAIRSPDCGTGTDSLRNVPDALHRGLKARAAMAGISLSDYLLAVIKESAEKPAELRGRLDKRKPVSVRIDTAHLMSRTELAYGTPPSIASSK
jgi:hypothetical protein